MSADILARFINNANRTDYIESSPVHSVRLLNHFGNPHQSLRTIHIAGTNGKGSVAHMLHAIFTRAGYRTGLYTSPHLLEVNERIIVNRMAITDRELNFYIGEIIDYVDSDSSLNPTFFDLLTVCAFRYFHDRAVDVAIIEVGLGGRLDSTNVISPLCSIITEISLDHTAILGDDLVSIAREKGGIIKEMVPVAAAQQPPHVLEILKGIAAEKDARFFSMGREFSAINQFETEGGYRFDYRLTSGTGIELREIEIRHPLTKQVGNACLAITAALITRFEFPLLKDDVIRSGLHELRLKGRFETLSADPPVIFDPAHNESAIAEMTALLVKKRPRKEITIVLMLMKDKNLDAIFDIIRSLRLPVIYFASMDARCHLPDGEKSGNMFAEIIHRDESLLYRALDPRISGDSLFFFTGSFRLYRTALNYALHCAENRQALKSSGP
ncbi:MAG: hypothetical protein E4G96_05155 [Chrysiogenales bacterium]|nr:MAG: hypothetical protein E4G96_05155 [Chrysiogenales bacterium]